MTNQKRTLAWLIPKGDTLVTRKTRTSTKTRVTSHFLKEMSQKRGEMCLFCAKKWFTLGCFTEKTYICSDK